MDLEALLYTDEAAQLAQVEDATIRSWALRYSDILPVRARDRRDRPKYRAGDVLNVESMTRVSR